MYRYLLFGFETYYPQGGMGDLIARFNNLEECVDQFNSHDRDASWFQLVDIKNIDNIKTRHFDILEYDKQGLGESELNKDVLDWIRYSIQ